MTETIKSWFGIKKKSDVDNEEDNMTDVQERLAELSKNVNSYDAKELAAQLEKMSKALSQPKSRVPITSSGDQEPPLVSKMKAFSPVDADPIPQSMPYNEQQVMNDAGGYSFKVCDMTRLKRFLVIGTENGTYYSAPKELLVESVSSVTRLIAGGHGQAVLDLLEQYSVTGRVAKEQPILYSLMTCAMSSKLEVQKAAYKKIPTVCNIPTKLFFFLDCCQSVINRRRQMKPPEPQPSKKRKQLDEKLDEMEITVKEPSESIDNSLGPTPPKKQRRMDKLNQKFKKVNKAPKKSSGWGRMRRKGIASFYTDEKKDANRLLYLVTKYKQRHNWSHKQVLGYTHPKMMGEDRDAKNLVLTYATRGYDKYKVKADKYLSTPGVSNIISQVIDHIDVLNKVSKLSIENEGDEDKLLDYLKNYGIRNQHEDFTMIPYGSLDATPNPDGRRVAFQVVREHIPTNFLKSKKVWEALLVDMPMTAMIRNLGKMSSLGLFEDSNGENIQFVKSKLADVKQLKKARIHPIKILIALRVYQSGSGDKGSLTWPVNQQITTALDSAFYLAFRSVDVNTNFKTGKKFMLCLDVSGSMTWQGCYGCEQMTPAMASVAMAMVTWNIEDNCEIMAFGGHFESLKNRLNKEMTLDDAMRATRGMNFGSTDCSLPMTYALQQDLDVDVFIVYTDSDTWSGRIHPPAALKKYNAHKQKNAKLIVCAMQTNDFTIADPNDPNMMDIVGFDTGVPDIISEFAKGELSGKCDVCINCKAVKEKMKK